ncbi:MAG: c-type cytochrome [Gammaproteobacteria bacterium]
MKRIIAVLTGVVLCIPVAWAEPSSEVAFDVATVKLLREADPTRGEVLAKEGKCAKCHGDAGVSDDSDDVNIAGMRSSYLFKQLKDYQNKSRDDRDMFKKTRNLDDQQLADLSAWYASLVPSQSATDQTTDAATLKLIFHGDPKRLLKACASCHGWRGRGGQFDHPALAGQFPQYLIDTMTEFKEGDRSNDIYARMRDVAESLTEEEIENLARYYGAALPAE